MLYSIIRNALFSLDPETAHNLTIASLASPLKAVVSTLSPRLPSDSVTVMGLKLPNRVGLAAGLDKNGEAIDGLAALGFGFIEIGTVTPRAQSGNPKPRLFRLPEHGAIINRMGFNNAGIDRLLENVACADFPKKGGVLGINIGKNADTPIEKAVDDYLIGLKKAYLAASYITVNISSPNTKNLRDLQRDEALDDLLGRLKQAQQALADQHGKYTPIALKIAPDLDDQQIITIADALRRHQFDGVIATNTTLTRTAVAGHIHADETGGLSGKPVFELSNRVIRTLATALKGELPIIGAGGIDNAQTALSKIEAGAAAVQIYTGLIYRGPCLVEEAGRALASAGK